MITAGQKSSNKLSKSPRSGNLGGFFIYALPIILFALVISVNFSKPFGFFRESNPAMVSINAISWRQDETIKNKHIPVVSYAYDKNKNPETQLYNTSVTFGYAWFSVPYYFLETFNLPVNEVTIRVFSLIWLLVTLLAALLLVRQLTRGLQHSKSIIYLTLILYLFCAAVLWYHVQGYVHEIAVLPFYFLSWYFFVRYVRGKGSSLKELACLTLTIFIAIQFDWLPAFQAGVMSIYLLVKRRNMAHRLSFVLPPLAVVLAIAWIVFTFSNWATFPVYFDHVKEKFTRRTIGGGGLSILPWLNYNFNIVIFYITGYGLAAAVFLYGAVKKRNPTIIWLMILTALLHHVTFWGFSTEHDHGVVKMALPVCFITASVLSSLPYRKIAAFTAIILASNILIYFILHNVYKRPGIYANPLFCYLVGEAVKTRVPASERNIFINTEGKYFPQIEFYAGKSYIMANTMAEAKEFLHQFNEAGSTGYFINVSDASNIQITFFK